MCPAQIFRVLVCELRPAYKIIGQRGGVRHKVLVVTNLAAVGFELGVIWFSSECAFIEPVDKVTALLKLNREEKGSGDVDAFDLNALRIAAAISNLVSPKIEATRVRLAIKKVQIVLTNKELRVVNRVCPVHRFVVVDRNENRTWRTQHYAAAARITQRDDEAFAASFSIGVVDDWYRDSGEALAGCEMQTACGRHVVARSRSAPRVSQAAITAAHRIEGRIVHIRSSRYVAAARYCQSRASLTFPNAQLCGSELHSAGRCRRLKLSANFAIRKIRAVNVDVPESVLQILGLCRGQIDSEVIDLTSR